MLEFDDGLIVHLWSDVLLVVHAKHNRAEMLISNTPPTGSAGSMPSDQTDYRFSPPFDELPIDQKGKKRGSSTDLESEAFDPMAAFTQKSDRIFEEYLRGSDYTKRANTKLEEDLTKKERRSGS